LFDRGIPQTHSLMDHCSTELNYADILLRDLYLTRVVLWTYYLKDPYRTRIVIQIVGHTFFE
jgi:hypothetical protein